jgi:hypothetical protein
MLLATGERNSSRATAAGACSSLGGATRMAHWMTNDTIGNTSTRGGSAMRVLGVNCTSTAAYFAVADRNVLASDMPERLKPSIGMESGMRLLEFKSEVSNVLGKATPDRVMLLLAEPKEKGGTHQQHAPRIAMETLIRVAAAEEDLPLDLLQRATVRSRLALPKTGSLLDALNKADIEAVGQYWTTGRGLAALAALAGAAE